MRLRTGRRRRHHYGILRRSTEELLATVSKAGPDEAWVDALKAIRKTWNDIDDGAPHVPQEMYDRVVRKMIRTEAPDQPTRSFADVAGSNVLEQHGAA